MNTTDTEAPAVELADQLADELEGAWTVKSNPVAWPHGRTADLIGPAGELLRVNLGGGIIYAPASKRDRWFLTGKYRLELLEHARRPELQITASITKTPAQIARELERRLLPDYRDNLAVAEARKATDDERTGERTALLDDAAGVLAPLGLVTRWLEDGRLTAGAFGDPMTVDLTADLRYPAVSNLPTRATVTVKLRRELLPALVRALAGVAGPGPESPPVAPAEVWVVHRADTGALEAYADRWRAEQYADAHEGATAAPCTVMNDSAAGQYFIDSVGDDE